ncbi:glycoside hydrolase family 28 protein [Streptomyces scopuliridis]|uniref:glycosyl hydrolase family 28 protein n=1 Tax=Streptomyces scopuliridis TaxID=452529 RepID=UPI002DDC0FAB|nr:glycosyl hydrolase family 28 protein [Streptomyces scopuliridis]WSB37963.1 glycoside hydrolase family 28 protein [Streptomyces scopuliridis]
MSTSMSRRSALQAAGASALGAGPTGSAGADRAADGTADASLVTYAVPAGAPTNDSFSVKVRTPGRPWRSLGVYLATLSMVDTTTDISLLQNSSLAFVDFSGSIEVLATYTKATIRTARVRPDSYEITPDIRSGTIAFTLDEPRNVVVQVNEDVFDCLHLFARPLETDRPAADDPDVLYFGPGVHTTDSGTVTVGSGQTVYLDGGAVLTSRVLFKDVRNARLAGRGVIWAAPGGGATVERSTDISISGVTMLNPDGYAVTIGQSQQITLNGMAAFSSKVWGDGIDVFSSSDVTIDGVFLRNADDCIALYTHRWDYYGDTRNITVQNSTLWADVAHPVNVGTHGNTADPEVLENLTFRNIDILDHREPQTLYQGCIALNPGDSNLVRDVRVEDVRVEDFRQGQLINMRVMFNRKYNSSPGRGIDTVYVKNLTYTGTHANPSLLAGYDGDRLIQNVTFENLVVNGVVIADSMEKPGWYPTSDFVPMHVNEHVKNLTFLTSAEAAT